MLVLTRKRGQDILVPEEGIVFRILEIRGDQVRIGLSAPSKVQVFRGELWARMQEHIPLPSLVSEKDL